MSQAFESGLTSVIVVTADSGPLAVRCVDGVLASRSELELVVVDNASQDGQIENIERRFGNDRRLRILRNPHNLGFGAACNLGAGLARGDALLILNPDCLMGADVIGKLREVARQLDDVGMLGVRVLDANGEIEPASRRRDPLLGRALRSLVGKVPGLGGWKGIDMVDVPVSAEIERVDAISGACMFLPRAVFDRLGGFDESYFLHCEDLDLCRRARDAGHAVYHVSTISVRHEQGSSSFRRPLFVSRHKHHSMWRYFRNFDPAARNGILSGVVWLGIWTHFALLAPIHAWRQWRARRRT